jgi:hypothetical protein
LATDYEEIAEDIETGATEIRHPELVDEREGLDGHAVRAGKGDPSLSVRRMHCAAISVRILWDCGELPRPKKFEKIVPPRF